MLNFLFKKKNKKNNLQVNEIYPKLKELYNFEEISSERKDFLGDLMQKYGYLPYPHFKALNELTPAETLFCLEFKFKNEATFCDEKFNENAPSPLERNNIKDADWIKKEGHDIKLINLAALGNGNNSSEAGKFIDWLKQLVILPIGVKERNIFATTIYLIPFQEREFGCAYLPSSSDVSTELADEQLKSELNLDVKQQVQLFIALAQYAGHPVIYDVLPQTGRFSKIVLANPNIARWFDLKELNKKTNNCIELVAKELEKKFDPEDVEIVKDIYKQEGCGDLSADYQVIYNEFEKELEKLKRTNSKEMLKKENQIKIQKKVKEIVASVLELKPSQALEEKDITKQFDIVKKLMSESLWTAPGGAWCSAGAPVFDKMSECGGYPLFKHYDYKDKDVSEFANLDCQTPFYFTFLENGELNKPVIDFFVQYVKDFREEYNFDGIRFDHVDHIIDEVSLKDGKPISYRIPSVALAELNSALKIQKPYFASLAEYMGGEYFEEYHENMKFDLLWGDDIPAQDRKTPEVIVEDNQYLSNYNTKNFKVADLSILKTYNNQDGEFSVINQYPALLGFNGALFKWFKYKFLPGGKYAQRPVLYVDGDESFTKTGVEKTICNEISLKREFDLNFFKKFDAINRLAKSQELVTEGEAQIILQEDDGFVSWMISKEPLKTAFLVVANYLPETEDSEDVLDKTIRIPGDYSIKSEFEFNGQDFVGKTLNFEDEIVVNCLKPSEFKIYLLEK